MKAGSFIDGLFSGFAMSIVIIAAAVAVLL